MTGLRRTIFALAAIGLRWLAGLSASAADRLYDAADRCEARSRPPRNPGRRDEPPWPQGP